MLVPDLPEDGACQEVVYEIKKSRFIARLYPVANKQQIKQVLDEVRSVYPDARHHCWAYVIAQGSSAGMSDDGEPSGTAGKPILGVLQHKHITDVMVVVSRYFGGIKLGAGGLVRAYSNATQQVLDCTPCAQPIEKKYYKVEFDFALEQRFRHWLKQLDGDIVQLEYRDAVCGKVAIPEPQSELFLQQMQLMSVSYELQESQNH